MGRHDELAWRLRHNTDTGKLRDGVLCIRKVNRRINCKPCRNCAPVDATVAHDLLNHRAANLVICRKSYAAHRGKLVFRDPLAVNVQLRAVLGINAIQVADCGHAEANQIGRLMRAVALKIASQTAISKRFRQWITRLGEVIQANGFVPRIDKALGRIQKQLRALLD